MLLLWFPGNVSPGVSMDRLKEFPALNKTKKKCVKLQPWGPFTTVKTSRDIRNIEKGVGSMTGHLSVVCFVGCNNTQMFRTSNADLLLLLALKTAFQYTQTAETWQKFSEFHPENSCKRGLGLVQGYKILWEEPQQHYIKSSWAWPKHLVLNVTCSY